MDTVIRPAEFVKEQLGKNPTLIYGDIERGGVVLYSNAQLADYTPIGDVYGKKIPFKTIAKNDIHELTNLGAKVYPRTDVSWRGPTFERVETLEMEPPEKLKRIFGVGGSFGYIPSAALLERYYPKVEIGLKIVPSDIPLSHEGAHVVSVNQIGKIKHDYMDMVRENDDKNPRNIFEDESIREDALFEAVAFFVEEKYCDRFHSRWRPYYNRVREQDQNPEYREASRLLKEEPQRIEELISRIRTMNLSE